MNYESAAFQELPSNYIFASILLLGLTLEVLVKRKVLWAMPALLTYGTVALWYFVEIIYTPEIYQSFPSDIVELAFIQVIVFLISYRLLVPYMVKKLSPRTLNSLPQQNLITLSPDRLLYILATIWLLILLIRLSSVNWDIIGVLLPIGSRASSIGLFSRPGIGGALDFIVSSLGYIYNLICSFFGVTIYFQQKTNAKIINLSLIIISWPMFLFLGTRNALLAIVVPCFLTYLFISKHKIWFKILVASLSFLVINYLLTIMIAFRNVGFEDYITQIQNKDEIIVPETQHEGLNMAEELFYINTYLNRGSISLHYGYDYLGELLNVVPRALWSDKPLIGYDYARLRAPGSGSEGITATVSRGLIGGGVMNFGSAFGPIAPAFLMAVWSGILARFWQQRESILRLALFLVGLGITPNLGRDFTLLVLWPMIFGYFIILYLERRERKRRLLNSDLA